MADVHPRIARLLNPGTTLDDVEAAYSGTHPTRPEYSWAATAQIRGESIAIEGNFFINGTEEVGQFERRLIWRKKARRAVHELIEVYGAHRDRDLAYCHFIKVFDFYIEQQYAEILLKAAHLGPRVWPQFGFEIADRQVRERLLKLLKAAGVAPPANPIAEGLFAAWAASQVVDGRPVGVETLDRLYLLTNSNISMYFDLGNPGQRQILASRRRAGNAS